MSNPTESLDPARSRLRATVASIDAQIASLKAAPAADGEGAAKTDTSVLSSAWADLVGQLALGPEPELRECPFCHKFGMRAAKVCGSCWTKLTPPTDD